MSRRYRPFDPFDRGPGQFDPRREIRLPQVPRRVRAGPGLRAVGIQRSVLRSTAGWVTLGAAGVISIILAAGASAQWSALALYLHATPTGTTDPVLNQDISFYLLTLPFLHAATN